MGGAWIYAINLLQLFQLPDKMPEIAYFNVP